MWHFFFIIFFAVSKKNFIFVPTKPAIRGQGESNIEEIQRPAMLILACASDREVEWQNRPKGKAFTDVIILYYQTSQL